MSTIDPSTDPHPIPTRIHGPVGVVVSLLLRLGYTLRAADGASASGAVHSASTLADALLHLSAFPRPGGIVALNVHAPAPPPPPASPDASPPASPDAAPDASPDAASPEPIGPVVGRVTVADSSPLGATYEELDAERIPIGTFAAVGAVAAGSLAVDALFLISSLWPDGISASASPREYRTHDFLSRFLYLREFATPSATPPRPSAPPFGATGRSARAALALRVLDVVESWISDHRVSCPESLLRVDAVNQSLPDFAERLASLAGWHRGAPDLDDEP
jgi:hypothetical protein